MLFGLGMIVAMLLEQSERISYCYRASEAARVLLSN